MAGGDGHFMLRQDYRVLEGIMMAEGENNGAGGSSESDSTGV